MRRGDFLGPFSRDDLPSWPCPECARGSLILVNWKSDLRMEETTGSKKARASDDWEPDWEENRFTLWLQCHRCKEPVAVVGRTAWDRCEDPEDYGSYELKLLPSFFHPAVRMIDIPASCPEEVRNALAAACRLHWTDPSACVGRLRAALEELFPAGGSGTALDARIKAQAPKEVLDHYVAVKWLGNVGAHTTGITAEQALDAFDLLEHALREHFEKKTAKLNAMAVEINVAKGVPKGP